MKEARLSNLEIAARDAQAKLDIQQVVEESTRYSRNARPRSPRAPTRTHPLGISDTHEFMHNIGNFRKLEESIGSDLTKDEIDCLKAPPFFPSQFSDHSIYGQPPLVCIPSIVARLHACLDGNHKEAIDDEVSNVKCFGALVEEEIGCLVRFPRVGGMSSAMRDFGSSSSSWDISMVVDGTALSSPAIWYTISFVSLITIVSHRSMSATENVFTKIVYPISSMRPILQIALFSRRMKVRV